MNLPFYEKYPDVIVYEETQFSGERFYPNIDWYLSAAYQISMRVGLTSDELEEDTPPSMQFQSWPEVYACDPEREKKLDLETLLHRYFVVDGSDQDKFYLEGWERFIRKSREFEYEERFPKMWYRDLFSLLSRWQYTFQVACDSDIDSIVTIYFPEGAYTPDRVKDEILPHYRQQQEREQTAIRKSIEKAFEDPKVQEAADDFIKYICEKRGSGE